MKRILLFLIAACICAMVPCHAQTPRDVPEVASWEIQRRGNMVEQTGTFRSGLMAAALSPPADDSAKWYVTLVYKPGEVNSENMLRMIATDKDIRPWIDAADSVRSTTHYQKRSIEDRTQADWLSGLRGAIAQKGLPLIVLQPPSSGQFGEPKTIVKMIHGVCTGKELADKLRQAIVAYVQAIEDPSTKLSGIREERGHIGSPPPFNVPPPVESRPAAAPAAVPFEYPPSAPQPLTIDQVNQMCPGAPPEFVLSIVTAKETSADIVRMRWLVYQQQHPAPAPAAVVVTSDVKPEASVVNPSLPSPMQSLSMVALVLMGFGVGLVISRWTRSGGNVANGGIAESARMSLRPEQINPQLYTTQPNQLSQLVPRSAGNGVPNELPSARQG